MGVFKPFMHRNVGRCWDQLKSELRDRGLTDSLQPELAAVADMFKARHRAAHLGALLIGARFLGARPVRVRRPDDATRSRNG
ncbi:MAG TPA: hypothetical protein VMM60_13680 [Ilumatobacter sp.]|nr:hypothetical protein [Ilumatobacter sp.]